jgi:hypothetical protein
MTFEESLHRVAVPSFAVRFPSPRDARGMGGFCRIQGRFIPPLYRGGEMESEIWRPGPTRGREGGSGAERSGALGAMRDEMRSSFIMLMAREGLSADSSHVGSAR